MTYEESLIECAWCGSEHIETVVGYEPNQLALCHDCNNRYRKREPEFSWVGEEQNTQHSFPLLCFAAEELAEAVRNDRLYELAWQKLYDPYARELDGVDFRDLVKEVRRTILCFLAGKLESGTGLIIPVIPASREKAHDTIESSTCLVHNNGGT